MRFCAYAVITVPDVATLRRSRHLEDLDDKSLSKMLAHERKQHAAGEPGLGWDQQAIAAMAVLRHGPDAMTVEAMNLSTHAEDAMLRSLFDAVADSDFAVAWDAERDLQAMIRFRALLRRVSLPDAWAAADASPQGHIDLASSLAPSGAVLPRLDDTAKKLGFPGLLDIDALDVIAAWLNEQPGDIQALCEIQLLNLYLVALRLFAIRGLVTRYDSDRHEGVMREWLESRDELHFQQFLQDWGRD
jgi:predicted PolB exonuclease-like 3'-5' exonuclease